jgi:hypothetical protein
VVPAGSVTSGAESEPAGEAGAATPAIEVMASVGPVASPTTDGLAIEGGMVLVW